MKKLISGLVMFSALSSFAQSERLRSMIVEDISYGKSMTFKCETKDCEYISMVTDDTHYDDIVINRIIKRSSMMETIKNRRGQVTQQRYYDLSSDTVENIKKNNTEGYNGKAIGNSVLLLGAGIVDTVIFVPQLIIQAFTPKRDSKKVQNGAKRINNNLSSDIETVRVKHKYYMQMRSYASNRGTKLLGPAGAGDLYKCVRLYHNDDTCGSSTYKSRFYVKALDSESATSLCGSVEGYIYQEKVCSVEKM